MTAAKPGRKRLTFRMPKALAERVKKAAKADRMTVNDWVSRSLMRGAERASDRA